MSATSLEPSSSSDRRTEETESSSSSLIPGLPDDVVSRITTSVWRIRLKLVSKAWKRAVEDPFPFQCRGNLRVSEEWVYAETWNQSTRVVSWYPWMSAKESGYLHLPYPPGNVSTT
ncbi:hypothetical protein R1flu_011162 [Riccia fluitans]|uniref:F-box domain-containing protein n=1 Tax=Riccia fluitans TaxID=41844 RepID=A0ABD1Z710_9MARC